MFSALNINYLLCTSLFLLLFFNGSFTYGSYEGRSGTLLNRPRRGFSGSIPDYDGENDDSVSDLTDPVEEPNLKHEAKIKSALANLRQVLISDSEDRYIVDEKVIDFFTKRNQFWSRASVSEHKKKGPSSEVCSEVRVTEIPRPTGLTFLDKLASSHFVINIPDFNQTTDALKCVNINRSCLVEELRRPRPSPGKCQPNKIHVKVLMLPNSKTSFDISDFKISTYEVNGGCTCVKSARPDVNVVINGFLNNQNNG